MSQVDDIKNALDQRHPKRHQPIESANQDAVDQDLRKQHGRRLKLT